MLEAMPKRFHHDCSGCVYLGRMGDLDAYLCPGVSEVMLSIILRHGDDGPEYASTLLSAALYSPCDSPLHKLAKEVVHKGLVRLSVRTEAVEEQRELWRDS